MVLNDHLGSTWDWTDSTERLFSLVSLISIIRQKLSTYQGKDIAFYSIKFLVIRMETIFSRCNIANVKNSNVQDVQLSPLRLQMSILFS